MADRLAEIEKRNAEFWDELCGSSFAQYLGITDHGPESLRRFDQGYLDYYPYLLERVRIDGMKGKRVLEIGLGYGTLGQKIAEAGADYVGLDIARGPVRMMNHRLRMAGLGGVALQGSMLNCPLQEESCDAVVSIGCFHHTGDVKRCIRETHRVLKRGGRAFLMVYNQYSYRQWLRWPWATLGEWFDERALSGGGRTITEAQKKAYDADSSGAGAPETVFLSVRRLRDMLADFSEVRFFKENCTDFQLKGVTFIPRKKLLATVGCSLGLDIYLEAVK